MKDNKRFNFAKGVTPLGTFIFPKVKAPDTKFKEDGEYQCRTRLSEEDSEQLIARIEQAIAAHMPVVREELEQKIRAETNGAKKGKLKKQLEELKEADRGYKPSYDDEGTETGEYEFNFKAPAKVTRNKGKPNESKVDNHIDVFSAQNVKLAHAAIPDIWTGTTGYVSYELRPFFTAVGVGVSLRLKAIKIKTLASGGGGSRDAGGYGFGDAEDGYEADTPFDDTNNNDTGAHDDDTAQETPADF